MFYQKNISGLRIMLNKRPSDAEIWKFVKESNGAHTYYTAWQYLCVPKPTLQDKMKEIGAPQSVIDAVNNLDRIFGV